MYILFSSAPGSMTGDTNTGEYTVVYAVTGVYTFTCTATSSDGNTKTESVAIRVGSQLSMYSGIPYYMFFVLNSL